MSETKEQIESFFKNAKVWSFNVKFNTTDANWNKFEQFKIFCKEETGDNYLQGISKLLDYYKADFKYASLFDLIDALKTDLLEFSTKTESQIGDLIDKKEEPKEDNIKTFGEVERGE